MSYDIHPELSSKSKYYLDKHRYYELKHFCLQYPIWVKALSALSGFEKREEDVNAFIRSDGVKRPVERVSEARAFFSSRVDMVRKAAEEADPELKLYLLAGVTEGLSYSVLNARSQVPGGRDAYYESYRRFFWILSRMRG